MSSSFGLLALVSRDLSQAKKETIVCWAEQIHKMTKGQIISECPYEIIVFPIRPMKKFPRFLP